MAQPQMDTTQADSVLKEDLTSPLQDLVRSGAYLFKRMVQTSRDTEGSDIKKPLTVGHPQGIGASSETGALPTAVPTEYNKATFVTMNNFGSIKISEKAILVSRNSRGAFTDLLLSDMKNLMLNLKKDLARQFWGDGTGQLTVCNTTTSTTVLNVVDTKWLEENMAVDVIVSASGATSTGALAATISAVDPDAGTATLSASVSTDRTFSVYRKGSRNLEIHGLQAAVSTTDPAPRNYGGIARTAATRWWKGNVFANGGTPRALTVDLMDQTFDEVSKYGKVTDILTSLGARRKFWALFREDRRFSGEGPMTVDGGYDVLKYRGAQIYADPDCHVCGATISTLNKFYFLDMSTFTVDQLKDIGWLEADGAVLKQVAGYPMYQAHVSWYSNVCCSNPRANGVLADITES